MVLEKSEVVGLGFNIELKELNNLMKFACFIKNNKRYDNSKRSYKYYYVYICAKTSESSYQVEM